jgi:O-antigen/teichoic acid export membrane protein
MSSEEARPRKPDEVRTAGSRSSLLRNIASNWAITACSIAYAFFVTPVIVRGLGQQEYGVWSFLNGLIGYSNLLYLGVGSALVKNIATLSAKNDPGPINRLTSAGVTIFTGLGFLALVVFFGLSPFVSHMFADGLPSDTARQASLTCSLLGVQILCFFLTSGFMATLIGRDRFDLANGAQIVTIVTRFALVRFVVQGDNPLVRLAIFMTATSVVELLVVRTLAHRVDPSLRVRFTKPTADELKILYGFGIPAFLITFSLRLISYTDTTVVGAVLGAGTVGIYALPMQLLEYARILIGSYSGVLISRVSVLYASHDMDGLRQKYFMCLRVTGFIAAFCLTNLVWLGVPFLTLWAGPEFGEPSRWVIIWLAVGTFLQVYSTFATVSFFQSMHILGKPAKVLMLEALLNLILSIWFAHLFGVSGVAFATFLPTCMTFLILPPLLSRPLAVSTFTWIRIAMLPAMGLAAAVSISQWVGSYFVPPTSILGLTIRTLSTMPAAALVVLLTASSHERVWLVANLRRLPRTLRLGAS